MHVGEDGALWFGAGDPLQRLREMAVAGVRGVAQGVDDPDLDPRQRRECRVVQAVYVGRIGDRTEAKAELRMRPWRWPKARTGRPPPAPAMANGATGSGMVWASRMGG